MWGDIEYDVLYRADEVRQVSVIMCCWTVADSTRLHLLVDGREKEHDIIVNRAMILTHVELLANTSIKTNGLLFPVHHGEPTLLVPLVLHSVFM